MIYDKNDTVYFKSSHQTYTYATNLWNDSDPDTGFPKITILDPNGVIKVDAETMTRRILGGFEYLYTILPIDVSGRWTGYIEVENAGYPDREVFRFNVK